MKRIGGLWGAVVALTLGAAPGRADELSERASLAQLEARMLAQHPALREASARAESARIEARERGGRPPPELVYQQWAVPLARPYDLSRANMVMVGARVPIPSRAVRMAEARAAELGSSAAELGRAEAANELLYDLRTSYAEYVRATDELALHEEHAQLVSDVYALAKVAYATNQASGTALHETRVALGKLHGDIAMIEADLARARVRLNLLSGRPADAPLGPPEPLALADGEHGRAELARAGAKIAQSEAEARASELAAKRPEWMVGLDYMAMPDANQPWNYGAMVSMSLPWFSSSLKARAARARSEAEAERAALEGEKLTVQLEIEEARVDLTAAERSVGLVEHEWLAHAREAYEVERDAWKSGRSDARTVLERLDALLEARVALVRARRDVNVRKVALSRALGGGT